ncbi:hypothetical protein GCM10027275_08640 [Rhabdobacter roseus]|uniref:Uncharacterized protein n=1 Tax=Rhabdobacter roseus TaxID=1655419 RepID=A0A840TH16_9BACT|nr:hypothetical protein [Rhabdobacter roseus]MBB5282764.1 hypothetical protein [Rhabdobacter roseus]
MKKRGYRYALWLGQWLFFCAILSCNSQSVEGVYGGLGVRFSAMGGGSLQRDDMAVYLRKDGTFTDELDEEDWKTAVKGKYVVKGNEVILTYNNNKKSDTYERTSKGHLKSGSTILMRLEMNGNLPALGYKTSGGTSTGGGLSGTPYIGTFSQNFIRFDGKGSFSREHQGTVLITGDNIGGGTNNKDESGGTYTYKDGVLQLKYSNGQTEKHSFFFSKSRERIAVIDGRIYVEEKEKSTPKEAAQKPDESEKLPSVAELLNKVKEVHGGRAIDAIRDVKVVSQARGMVLLNLNDYQKPRSLAHVRVAGKLAFVQYREGNEGWQWMQGKKSPMEQARIQESEANRYAGISGLHTTRLAELKKGTLEVAPNGDYELRYLVQGKPLKLLVDKKYRITGEEIPSQGKVTKVAYKNFKEVAGVLFPFTEIHTSDAEETEIKITDYFINTLTEKEWEESAVVTSP